MRTVARPKLHLISEPDLDVRLRLKTLQDHFQISNQQQILELSSQYATIQQKRKNQNADTWLNEYSRITTLCRSENMAEMRETSGVLIFTGRCPDPDVAPIPTVPACASLTTPLRYCRRHDIIYMYINSAHDFGTYLTR
jgi:hypothetical protein